MTSIQINITINEEQLRVRANKAYQAAKKAAYRYFNQACEQADAFAGQKSTKRIMATVSMVLRQTPTEWPKHSIMCECYKCKPVSTRTYCKRIMSA